MAAFGWVSNWFGAGAAESTSQAPQAFTFRNPWRTEDDAGGVAPVHSSGPGVAEAQTQNSDARDHLEVSASVRAIGKKKLQDAWAAFQSEFDVTLRIWESVIISQGAKGKKAERDRLQSSIQGALRASTSDPVGATKLLSPILQGFSDSAGGEQFLNVATVTSAQNVLKAERKRRLHDKLANLIQSAVGDADRVRAETNELESTLGACKLQDKSLESRVRRILGMGASKEDKARAAREEKAAQAAALERKIRQVAEVAGVSRDHARKAINDAGGDADLALIMLLSDPDDASQREKRLEKKAAAAEKKREAVEAAAVAKEAAAIAKLEASQSKLVKAKELALNMAKLASSTQKMAWAQVRTEFDVQLKVWETQALLCTSSGGVSISYAETQNEIKGVLLAAERDPRGAVMMLEMVLQTAVERGLELCTGMISAADETLDADSVANYRRQLAGMLRDAAKSLEDGRGVPTRGPAQEKEIADLISACQFKDSNFAVQAKMALDPHNVSL